jgi:uncharacterized membrane protein
MPQEQKHEKENPNVNRVVRDNIMKIVQHRIELTRKRTLQERVSDALTDFSGTMLFVYLHILWFIVWFLINTGVIHLPRFDPYPYGLLTLIVSLESIFLSAFLLISQNRMSKENENRAELDLQINLLTERELTLVLQMLDRVQEKLGIENLDVWELSELKQETKPEEILAEIEQGKEEIDKKK